MNCSCVKAGRLCVGCLSLRKGNCFNQGATSTSPPSEGNSSEGNSIDTNSLSAVNSVDANLPPSLDIAFLYSCSCGRPDNVQPMVRCQGPGKAIMIVLVLRLQGPHDE